MADKTIGDLNNAPGTVDDSNTLFVVQQAGTAYKLDGHAFILALTSILDGHGGINSIVYTAPVYPSLDGTLTITLADTTQTSLTIRNGKGIVSIAKTGTAGLVDTYTITYNDGTTGTFTVTNGAKGDTGDAWYVWIRYAGQQPTQDSDIGTTPDNWMGIYSGTSSTAPTHYTDYQWFEIKGEKGDTGDPATVGSSEIAYQGSASGTTVPTGEWSTTIPVVPQGQYLWTRTTVTFNIGNPVIWYSVSYIAVDGTGSPGMATPLVDSGSGVVGAAMSYSRQDHQHPLNVATTGTPQMDGTASRGSEPTYARSDHIHPHDTSKADTGLGITGATVGDLARVNAVDANGTPTSWRKAPLCEITTNPNLLDNWYFVGGGSRLRYGTFPINQRGQTIYSNSGYTIDRWWCIFDTVTVLSDGLQLSTDSGASYPGAFRNAVTSPKNLAGKTVTLSILVTSISTDGEVKIMAARATGMNTGQVIEIDALSITSPGLYSKTVTLSSNVGSAETPLFFVGINTVQGTTAKVQAIKLELGSEQTLAHQENSAWVLNEIPDYAEQLSKCQAYYYVTNLTNEEFSTGGLASAADATSVNLILTVPATMAKTPTVTHKGRLVFQVGSTYKSATNPTFSVYNKAAACYQIYITGFTGLTAGNFGLIYAADYGTLVLSADL